MGDRGKLPGSDILMVIAQHLPKLFCLHGMRKVTYLLALNIDSDFTATSEIKVFVTDISTLSTPWLLLPPP